MKTTTKTLAIIMAVSLIISCKNETTAKLKELKKGISNTTTIVKNAKEAQDDIIKLKDAAPLTNDQLKAWLPEELDGMKRTAFKAGQAGYVNIATIEGTYNTPDTEKYIQNEDGKRIYNPENKTLKVSVLDGAGPTGSMMIAGIKMLTKMDMEEQDEFTHKKTVTKNGIKAYQVAENPRHETAAPKTRVEFVYKSRLGVRVHGTNLTLEETWDYINELDLDELMDEAS